MGAKIALFAGGSEWAAGGVSKVLIACACETDSCVSS
jgi:hypothetical protein